MRDNISKYIIMHKNEEVIEYSKDTKYNLSDNIEINSMNDILKVLEPLCGKPIIKNGVKNIENDIFNLWENKYKNVVSEEFILSRCNAIKSNKEKLSDNYYELYWNTCCGLVYL